MICQVVSWAPLGRAGPTKPAHKRSPTMLSKYLSIAAVALTVGVFAAPASAAPTANLQGAAPEAGESAAEKVAYKRCWWHRGHRHCRWVRHHGPRLGFYWGGHRRHWHGYGYRSYGFHRGHHRLHRSHRFHY